MNITHYLKAMLLALPLLFSNCKTPQTDKNPVLIKFEKTECYGYCPIYKIKVLGNGEAYMYPKSNMQYSTQQKAKIHAKTLKMLFSKANNINFWLLDSVYDNPLISDIPATFIGLSKNGSLKTIKARAKVPAALGNYIHEVEKTLLNLNWQPIN